MALDQIGNFIKATVQGGYGPSDAGIQLAAGQGARLPDPAAGAFNLVWWNATEYVDPPTTLTSRSCARRRSPATP